MLIPFLVTETVFHSNPSKYTLLSLFHSPWPWSDSDDQFSPITSGWCLRVISHRYPLIYWGSVAISQRAVYSQTLPRDKKAVSSWGVGEYCSVATTFTLSFLLFVLFFMVVVVVVVVVVLVVVVAVVVVVRVRKVIIVHEFRITTTKRNLLLLLWLILLLVVIVSVLVLRFWRHSSDCQC